MRIAQFGLLTVALAASASFGCGAEVKIIGQMRRMFVAHDIGPNVELSKVIRQPHVYALGPLAGLKGEITVIDSHVFASKADGKRQIVSPDQNAKAVFLVYASVRSWRTVELPTNIVNEVDLAGFLEHSWPAKFRSVFLVRGTAVRARHHIQNYRGRAEALTHEAHDKAKVFYELANTPVQLVGFVTTREEDAGLFVHQGQTTHIHII